MRVIAGTARGRPLVSPKSLGTRPTTDLVRGAIFSMLEARGAWFTRVLDLYAGSGALGIEALSRGVEWVDFVEQNRAACLTIAANLRRTGFATQGHVHCCRVEGALAQVRGPYGIVFLDAPYSATGVASVLAALGAGSLVDDHSTIVYEHGHRTIPPDSCASLPRTVTRAHGTTGVTLYYRPEMLAGNEEEC